jgi:GH24 family phage-related lysozyme (muramidase)
MHYPIIDEGVDLLKQSEDFVGHAYPDPVSPLGRALQKAGLWRQTLRGVPIPDAVRIVKGKELSGAPWTIGYGFTEGVNEGDTMTQAEGNARLARELVGYRDSVRAACKVEPNENQLAALVVCAWNIGKGAIASSSMVKAHNRSDFAAAARAFALWNKAGGKVVDALVRRRAAEAALYAKPAPAPAWKWTTKSSPCRRPCSRKRACCARRSCRGRAQPASRRWPR